MGIHKQGDKDNLPECHFVDLSAPYDMMATATGPI